MKETVHDLKGRRRPPLHSNGRADGSTSLPSVSAERLVVALGGNAIAGERGADPESQQRAVEEACEQIADLVSHGHEVVITHGNGPQVGNLLLKNDLARDVVPPVPLDWCVAQTQATLGFLIVTALEAALRRRGLERLVGTVITRVLVDADDPAWARPTKPIGRFVSADEAADRIAAGEAWEDRGERGWRRVVASPEPREILDRGTIAALMAEDAIVVAAGGGGIPMVREAGRLRGVEAVLDKDLTGALLARTVNADCFLIATDVEAAAVGFGSDHQEWLGAVEPGRLRELHARGEFAGGSMEPKVRAALSFAEAGGQAVITSLERLREGIEGSAGTRVRARRN
jgi:carbamate kinase